MKFCRTVVLVFAAMALAGCSVDQQPTVTPEETETIAIDASGSGSAPSVCDLWAEPDRFSAGSVTRDELQEASGLVVSRTHPDLFWAVNDSGHPTGLFAVGFDGSDRGYFQVVDESGAAVTSVDIEDLAIHDGQLYLADIGDNNSQRPTVEILIVDEPAPGMDGSVVLRDRVVLEYPDGATDAEGFVVDPLSGAFVIFDKYLGDTETRVFQASPPFGEKATLVQVTEFDLADYRSTMADVPPPAWVYPTAVTAADISDDGSVLVLRTYGTAWLFPRDGNGADGVASSFLEVPCEGGSTREAQGESLGVLPAGPGQGFGYVTVGEGDNRPVNQVLFAQG